jgi:hypothetical protein
MPSGLLNGRTGRLDFLVIFSNFRKLYCSLFSPVSFLRSIRSESASHDSGRISPSFWIPPIRFVIFYITPPLMVQSALPAIDEYPEYPRLLLLLSKLNSFFFSLYPFLFFYSRFFPRAILVSVTFSPKFPFPVLFSLLVSFFFLLTF